MKNLTPLKAIRRKCLDCCCFQPKEVALCTAENCPLYAFRTGHRPQKGDYTDTESYNEKTAPTTAKTENLSI